jgi:hypothetical protein
MAKVCRTPINTTRNFAETKKAAEGEVEAAPGVFLAIL